MEVIYRVAEFKDGQYRLDWKSLLDDPNVPIEAKKSIRFKSQVTAFPFVYIMKQKCGHYEVFEAPYKDKKWMKELIRQAKRHSETHICAHCASLSRKRKRG